MYKWIQYIFEVKANESQIRVQMGYEFQGHLVMFTHREKDIIVKVDQKFLVYMEELKLAFDSPTHNFSF